MAGVIDASFNKVIVKTLHPTFGAEIQVPDWKNIDDASVQEIRAAVDKVIVCHATHKRNNVLTSTPFIVRFCRLQKHRLR
jgi:hypothetical protein